MIVKYLSIHNFFGKIKDKGYQFSETINVHTMYLYIGKTYLNI